MLMLMRLAENIHLLPLYLLHEQGMVGEVEVLQPAYK
jgi:acyl-CoA-binding protein